MTFKEVKAELAKYSLGPDVELSVAIEGTGIGKLTLSVLRANVDTDGAGLIRIDTDCYFPLAVFRSTQLMPTIQELWMKQNLHEFHEWVRVDGERQYSVHS